MHLSNLVIHLSVGWEWFYLSNGEWMSSATCMTRTRSRKIRKCWTGVQIRSRKMSWRATSDDFTGARLGPRSFIITHAVRRGQLTY